MYIKEVLTDKFSLQLGFKEGVVFAKPIVVGSISGKWGQNMEVERLMKLFYLFILPSDCLIQLPSAIAQLILKISILRSCVQRNPFWLC